MGPAEALYSFAGVGFQENEVATLQISLNDQPDTTMSGITAEINWGDGASWDTGNLVYVGTNGSYADYIVKGSHVYQDTGNSATSEQSFHSAGGTEEPRLQAQWLGP